VHCTEPYPISCIPTCALFVWQEHVIALEEARHALEEQPAHKMLMEAAPTCTRMRNND